MAFSVRQNESKKCGFLYSPFWTAGGFDQRCHAVSEANPLLAEVDYVEDHVLGSSKMRLK